MILIKGGIPFSSANISAKQLNYKSSLGKKVTDAHFLDEKMD